MSMQRPPMPSPPAACCLLPTAHCLLPPSSYYLLPTTYYRIPTTYYRIPTTEYLLPTTYYRILYPQYYEYEYLQYYSTYYSASTVPTTYFMYHLIPATYCLLPTTVPTVLYCTVLYCLEGSTRRGRYLEIATKKCPGRGTDVLYARTVLIFAIRARRQQYNIIPVRFETPWLQAYRTARKDYSLVATCASISTRTLQLATFVGAERDCHCPYDNQFRTIQAFNTVASVSSQ